MKSKDEDENKIAIKSLGYVVLNSGCRTCSGTEPANNMLQRWLSFQPD